MTAAVVRRNELEEGELEEDEAHDLLVQNGKKSDPDVDLSHIDDKVEYLLGEFQKDFEGGVLVRNTGNTYGGYGSFLPLHESSPSDLYPARTARSIQNKSILQYSHNLSAEKFDHNESLKSSAMLRGNDTRKAPLPVMRAPTLNNSHNGNVSLPSSKDNGVLAAKSMIINRSDNPTEQKLFNILQKTDSGNILPENYGALSNGFKITMSPLSSGDILYRSRISSAETQESPEESPRKILEQDMTSFPLLGKCLLSPLPDHILRSAKIPTSTELVSKDSLKLSVPKNVASFQVPAGCSLGQLPGGLLCSTETSEKERWESMTSPDVRKVKKWNSNNTSPNKIPGERKSSPCKDIQLDQIKNGRMNIDKRSGMNQCDIGEEGTRKTPYKSNQLSSPDQQKDMDHHPHTPASGSTWGDEQHFAEARQDHRLAISPTVRNKKEYGSEDDKHSKSNAKRLAEQDSSEVTKKAKPANMHHADKSCGAEKCGAMRKLGSDVSNSVLIEKDAQKCSSYSFSKDSRPLEFFGNRSPVKMSTSCESDAAEVIKEGNELVDKADSLKDTGSKLESADLYFQAALKFLQGASLLEPCSNVIAKHREITDSMVMYREAAIFSESAADEYERCNEMAAAALAYRCMEVAYIRAVYSRAQRANEDRNELQMGLLNMYSGKSPSSSGSDVDNFYHQRMMEQGIDSQMAGCHAIVTRNRSGIDRSLNFVRDTVMAWEASEKGEKAFAAAKESEELLKSRSTIRLVQNVIDFSGKDIDRLVHLVGLAMEAINH